MNDADREAIREATERASIHLVAIVAAVVVLIVAVTCNTTWWIPLAAEICRP